MNAYLISYDNGESYEDHAQIPLCVVPTEARAKARIAEWLEWVEAQRAKMPEEPHWDKGEEMFERMGQARETFWKALKPPDEITCLISLVSDEYNRGSLRYREVKSLS